MEFRGHCESDVENVARFSTPVKSAVLPRWQRKQMEQQQALDAATPTRKPKTPKADRFIPNRSAMDMDASHFNLTTSEPSFDGEDATPSKRQYRADLQSQLFDSSNNGKILSFKQKAPEPSDGFQNQLRVLYSQNRGVPVQRKTTRVIPQAPIRTLDAPEMADDFYLNLLDWSATDIIAIGLGHKVYLWDACSGAINDMPTSDTPICSISWAIDGATLAVGAGNEVQLWDVNQMKKLRTMRGHAGRVGSLAWNTSIISSGSQDGTIHHNDVRIAQSVVAQLRGHTQEVCGLKWSPDGSQLASGSNDNLLNIWGGVSPNTQQVPLFTLTHHQSAVKALAWCPWQSNLLASGGGTNDRQLRFWNTANGSCINAVDTESQICSIVWSKEYRELVTSHGAAQNQLTIWRYPNLTKVAELTGHASRALHTAISPDGQTVASASADETMRLWRCFASHSSSSDENSKASFKTTSKAAHPRDNVMSGLSIR